MENTYFIHISTNTLPHYLVAGIILPTNFIKNRENDFQNKSGNQIILSTKKWNNINDCSIEVVLNDEELNSLEKISTDFALYHAGIPISRIKNLYFEDKEKAETVIWNINNTVAFVPNWAIKYITKNYDEIAAEYPNNYITKIDNSKELLIAHKKFDTLLGGFAFLKVNPELNSNNAITFSESYLSTLAFFNKRIESDIKKSNLIINDKFHKIFNGNSKIVKYLTKKIDATLVQEVAKEEGIQLKTNFGIIDLKILPPESLTFKLSILQTYGKENPKSVEDLIAGVLQKIDKEICEEVTLIYGLNVGYNALRNYYKFENQKVQIKYDLNSKIDFYTIESVYQYTFNNKFISADFDYLSVNFLFSQNNNKRNSEYKYIEVLNEYYPYNKIDYKEQKNTIIDVIVKEVFKWFPSELFKVNEDVLQEKLHTIINPELNKLIIDVRKDSTESFENNPSSIETILNNTQNPIKKYNTEKKQKTNHNNENNSKGKLAVNTEPSLFNDEIEIKSQVLNAKELDDLTIKELKNYAEELKIKIPKSILKRNDIISIILSNQD